MDPGPRARLRRLGRAAHDRDFEGTAQPCESLLGFQFEPDQRITFVPQGSLPHEAGFYEPPDIDGIVVEERPRLRDTALVHEMLHRHFWFTRSGADDPNHTDPAWQLVQACRSSQ